MAALGGLLLLLVTFQNCGPSLTTLDQTSAAVAVEQVAPPTTDLPSDPIQPPGPAFSPETDENVGSLASFDERTIPGPIVNVKDHGASGDGAADDTSAIQAAIGEAIRVGGTLYLPPSSKPYLISSALTVAGPLRVVGGFPQPTIKQSVESQGAFRVTASNVEITNLRLQGTGSATFYAIGADAVRVEGQRSRFADAVSLNHLTIEDWMFNGIILRFANFPRIGKNVISRISYSGISALSSSNGRIFKNLIADIRGSAHENGNAYGITISKEYGTEADFPNSTDFVVEENRVSRVMTWEGIDTHGGHSLVFRNNTVEDCRYGIVVTTARDASGYVYAGQGLSITGNVIRRSGALTQFGAGIQMGASTATHPADRVSINDNLVDGYGNPNDSRGAESGAIVVYITRNLTMMNNTIISSAGAGISLVTHVIGFTITGNRVDGTNGVGVNSKSGILLAGTTHSGLLENNVVTSSGGRGLFGFGINADVDDRESNVTVRGNTLGAGTATRDPFEILH